eukprot:scaffold3607_cov114-Isochrysis_galbana.AAC.31
MTSHNTQPTDHDKPPPLKQSASANDTPNGSRKRDQLKTITGAHAPWGHSGNLKEGTFPVRGDRGQPAGAPPPPLT